MKNKVTESAQDMFAAALAPYKREWFDGDTPTDCVRNGLTRGGFDFGSKAAIEAFMNAMEPYYHEIGQREKVLVDQYRATLIEAGCTQRELEVGDTHRARLTWKQSCQLESLEDQLGTVRQEWFMVASFAAVLNDARAQLEG